jgi:methyl-accepting chemotaxis protein
MRAGISKKLFGSLLGAFLVGSAVIATFVVWTYVVTESLLGIVEDMGAMSRRMETTAELQVQLHKLINTSGDYLITGDIEKRDEFDGIITGLLGIINELEEHRGGVRWNEALKKVREGSSRLSEMNLDLMFTDNPVGNMEAARLMGEAEAFADVVTNDAAEFHNIAVTEGRAMARDAKLGIARTRVFLYVLPLLGLLLFGLLYYYLKHHITMPLAEFYKGAERISRGDFEHSVTVSTGDELEGLAEGFNRMTAALKEREAKLISLLKVTDRINEELITAS